MTRFSICWVINTINNKQKYIYIYIFLFFFIKIKNCYQLIMILLQYLLYEEQIQKIKKIASISKLKRNHKIILKWVPMIFFYYTYYLSKFLILISTDLIIIRTLLLFTLYYIGNKTKEREKKDTILYV